MKRIIALTIMLILVFTLFGCSNNIPDVPTTNTTSSVTQEVTEPFNYLGFPVDWVSDIPLSEIRSIKYRAMFDIEPNMFISKSGDLYLFSLDKLFSNGQICKKVDTDLKFDRFYLHVDDRNLSTIISADGSFYFYDNNDSCIKNKDFAYTNDYTIEYSKKQPNSYGEYEGGYITYSVYYYVKGNDLYKAVYSDEGFDGIKFVSETVVDSIPADETFISLDGKVIKTDISKTKV